MNKPTALTGKMYYNAHCRKTGQPFANGPKCATCGDVAVVGTHPACERDARKRLMVWKAIWD